MEIKLKEFIEELTQITIKYNIAICGCGCCGSPYLTTENGKDTPYSDLYYCRKEKRYKIYNGVNEVL